MKKKKFPQKYIDMVNKQINDILNDKEEFDDWTQICFSMQDAVRAAATVWGNNTDEEKHALDGFIREMALREIKNLQNFDITFKKKNHGKSN